MIRSSHLIHQGIINLQSMDNAGNDLSGDSDMIFGNKIALLGGDYLLAHASKQIASLRLVGSLWDCGLDFNNCNYL